MKTKILFSLIFIFAISNSITIWGIQIQSNTSNGLNSYSNEITIPYENNIPNIFALFPSYKNLNLLENSVRINLFHIDSSEIFTNNKEYSNNINITENEESQVVEKWMSDFHIDNKQHTNLSSENLVSEKKIEYEGWMCSMTSWVKTSGCQ